MFKKEKRKTTKKKKTNRVILWCLLLFADARGRSEVFVAFLIWTPHFFIHIYVFSVLFNFLFHILSKRHSLRSVYPHWSITLPISRNINLFNLKCMFTFM